MARNVLVKVMGFRDVERHAIATLLRLSQERSVCYSLWTPEQPVPPDLVLVDLESADARQDLADSAADRELPLICIGAPAPPQAFARFQRPLQWPDVVAAMDRWVLATLKADSGAGLATDDDDVVIAPQRVTLVIGPHRHDRLYLRARLALAGHTEVDEASSGAQGLEMARRRHYDLVLADLEVTDMDGWALVRDLVKLEPVVGAVVVVSTQSSWHADEYASQNGCHGAIHKPYDPQELVIFLERLWRSRN